MTALRSISPQQALAIVDRAGVPDPQRLMVDFAAAGLVKGYALVIETLAPHKKTNIVRGAAISTNLWKRVQRESQSDGLWRGGTLRLGVDPANNLPEVQITGLTFSEKSVQRLIDYHGGGVPQVRQAPAEERQREKPGDLKAARDNSGPDPSAILPGAILATVNQAMAALGLGRTKINALMNDGRLIRRKVDRSTLIEVESIRRLAGPSSLPKP